MDRTFAALADPTRRAILNQLMDGPARVTEIAEPYSLSLNAISKHVRVLEQAGLVSRKVRGRDHWIRFNDGPLGDAANYVNSMLVFWRGRLGALEAALGETEDASDD